MSKVATMLTSILALSLIVSCIGCGTSTSKSPTSTSISSPTAMINATTPTYAPTSSSTPSSTTIPEILTPTPTSTIAPISVGPVTFNIGTEQGNLATPYLNTGDRVEFHFTVAGADVYYSAIDPNGKKILTGSGGNKVASGQGSFTASTLGAYNLHFSSSGTKTQSVLTVKYTVYAAR